VGCWRGSLERGADLHMAQLMPLPLTVSCFSKIQIGFTFLVPAHPGSPRQRAVKRVCVCVFVRACIRVADCRTISGSQSDFGTASIDVEQGLCRASICLCLSRLPTRCCCCGFAAVGPASRCRSVAHGCQPSISRSTAHSSKCGQCHVVS